MRCCYYHADLRYAVRRRRICGYAEEKDLRTLLFPCYLQLFGVDVRERDCGDESADAAVPMLFAAVRGRCSGARLRR